MVKIGIYPGTFDPVHNGHVAFARAALQVCALERVVFLPEPSPRGKYNVTDIIKRVAMLQLAVAVDPCLDVVALPDQQFTVAETLPKLQLLFGNELTFLLGSDVVKGLPNWPQVEQLYKAADIAVGVRKGDALPTLPVDVAVIPTPHAHIAASQVRQGVSQDVAPEVRDYMRANHLYVV